MVFAFFRRGAPVQKMANQAMNLANTQVLKNALRNYIKAVNKLNKNKLTNQDVTKILNNVNASNTTKTKIRNRLANGIARAIASSRHAIPAAVGAAFASAAAPNVSAGPKGNITETAAANKVNNATNNVNRAYILNTILKNTTLVNNNAKIQAMINYNPKVNFKSLVRANNSSNIVRLFTMANNAANSKYGLNRMTKNSAPSMPSKENNAVNIPAGFFNENAAKKNKMQLNEMLGVPHNTLNLSKRANLIAALQKKKSNASVSTENKQKINNKLQQMKGSNKANNFVSPGNNNSLPNAKAIAQLVYNKAHGGAFGVGALGWKPNKSVRNLTATNANKNRFRGINKAMVLANLNARPNKGQAGRAKRILNAILNQPMGNAPAAP